MPPSATSRDALLDGLVEHAYVYDPAGRITLASGQLSDEYINCKAALTFPHLLTLAAELMYERLMTKPLAVGGLTMGADPLAIAIALCSRDRAYALRWFTVRKERKGHGMQRLVEGNLPERSRVAVVEDVVTQGTSTLDAIDRLRNEGHTVVEAVALVDREQGGLQRIQETLGCDVPVSAIFTKSELRARWHARRG